MDRKTFEKIRWNNETGIAENPNNQHLVDEFLLSKKEAGNGNLSPMKAFFENRLGEKWQYLTLVSVKPKPIERKRKPIESKRKTH